MIELSDATPVVDVEPAEFHAPDLALLKLLADSPKV